MRANVRLSSMYFPREQNVLSSLSPCYLRHEMWRNRHAVFAITPPKQDLSLAFIYRVYLGGNSSPFAVSETEM